MENESNKVKQKLRSFIQAMFSKIHTVDRIWL